MAPWNSKKRKLDNNTSKLKPPKKIRKQEYYSSPSSSSQEDSDDFPAVNLAESDSDVASGKNPTLPPEVRDTQADDQVSAFDPSDDSELSSSSTSGSSDANHIRPSKSKSKRNDPSAFASSISAILSSKLSTTKRADPVLARSTTAAEANASVANAKLETKARQKLRSEKKEALEKGRVKDVLTYSDAGTNVNVGEMMEEEKRLRKTAQRGVIKLFNAVRQAQVRGEEAAREAKGKTRDRREEKVGEMSKKGFLELVAGGGNAKAARWMAEKKIEEG